MIIIAANDTIAAIAGGEGVIACTLFLMELNTSTAAETYVNDQQLLSIAAGTIYTATANGPTFVRSIHMVNTDLSNALNFQLFVGGTANTNSITPIFTIPAGGMAIYEDVNGWQFFDINGQLLTGSGFNQINIQSFASPGSYTYTPIAGMKHCMVIATGGGGGGGGAKQNLGGSGDVAVGAGGGAGGTCIGFFSASQVGVSKLLVVGAVGSGGSAATGGNGGTGGNTTWDTTTLVATGGTGGTGSGSVSADAAATTGGAGGVPTGGTINITGGSGEPGVAGSADGTTDIIFARSGKGASSFWGGGGLNTATASNTLTNAVSQAGGDSVTYGAGGSGAVSTATAVGAIGGIGMSGIIMVIEYL